MGGVVYSEKGIPDNKMALTMSGGRAHPGRRWGVLQPEKAFPDKEMTEGGGVVYPEKGIPDNKMALTMSGGRAHPGKRWGGPST